MKQACVECLGGVIGNVEAAGYADDVLGACSPEGLVDFSSDELVEDAVVHFLCWMLCERVLDDVDDDEWWRASVS